MCSPKETKELQSLFSTQTFIEHLKTFNSIFSAPRFKITVALRHFDHGLTVTEIAQIMDAPISRISHQLAIMRHAGLVRRRRHNREAIYMLDMKQLAKAHHNMHSMFRLQSVAER